MRRWLLIVGLAVLLAVGVAISVGRRGGTAPAKSNVVRPAAVSTVHAQGKVESASEVEVRSKAAGTMVQLLVAEGDEVRAGQTLALLDDSQQRAQLQRSQRALLAARERLRESEALAAHRLALSDRAIREAEARVAQCEAGKSRCEATVRDLASELDLARKEETRAKALAASGALAVRDLETASARVTSAQAKLSSSQAEVQAATAAIRSAQAALESARVGPEPNDAKSAREQAEEAAADARYWQAVLRDMVIRAPFGGTVTQKIAEQGQVLQAGEAVCLLAATQRTRVNAEVDETDIGKIRVGDVARVAHEAFPGRVFEGRVTRIGSLAGQHTVRSEDPAQISDFRVVDVKIEGAFPEALRLGMTVEVEIECR